jgi:hypothetical protein
MISPDISQPTEKCIECIINNRACWVKPSMACNWCSRTRKKCSLLADDSTSSDSDTSDSSSGLTTDSTTIDLTENISIEKEHSDGWEEWEGLGEEIAETSVAEDAVVEALRARVVELEKQIENAKNALG